MGVKLEDLEWLNEVTNKPFRRLLWQAKSLDLLGGLSPTTPEADEPTIVCLDPNAEA
jgi:hypothetical protein